MHALLEVLMLCLVLGEKVASCRKKIISSFNALTCATDISIQFSNSPTLSSYIFDFRHLGLVLNFALGKWSRGNKGSRMLGAGGVTKEPEKQGVH